MLVKASSEGSEGVSFPPPWHFFYKKLKKVGSGIFHQILSLDDDVWE
jgi:hypothetical protein